MKRLTRGHDGRLANSTAARAAGALAHLAALCGYRLIDLAADVSKLSVKLAVLGHGRPACRRRGIVVDEHEGDN